MENLWLHLVDTARATKVQNLTSIFRVNKIADIIRQVFAAVHTGLKPTWSGVPRLATRAQRRMLVSICGLVDGVWGDSREDSRTVRFLLVVYTFEL